MPDTGETPADRREAVCVIGAGASGLTAVKNLREHGFAVDCYERDTSVGGAWNWRHDRSPVSANVSLVTSRPLTEFPDFPMPDSWPDYPHHSQVLSYLERYAAHFGLTEHIWFGTEVVAVVPVGDGRWDVTTRSSGGGSERTQRYAAVVVANGHNWAPRPLEGSFSGRLLHASAYQDPAQLRGRKVLVVGGGNTGCDLAVEAAQHAAKVWHSTRRGYWYLPKYAFGRPVDQLNARVRNFLHGRQSFGGTPEHRPAQSHAVVNSLLDHYLRHDLITPVAGVVRLDGPRVELADGATVEPDLVVAATGYQPRFEFLAPELLDVDASGRPDLHLHAFARRHPTLAVIGLLESDSGLFPLAHWQSVAVARWLRLRRTDPVRALAVQQKESVRPVKTWARLGMVPSPRHWFEVGHVTYLRAVEELLTELEPA